jgi:hypothetical protein
MVTSKYEQNRKNKLLDNPALAAMRASQQAKASAKWRKTIQVKPKSKILRKSLSDLPGSCFSLVTRILYEYLSPPWGSPAGFPVHIDVPSSNPPMGNLTRPAVKRQDFGLDCTGNPDGPYTKRFVYATGAGARTVGTDVRYLQTKRMSADMIELARVLQQELIDHQTVYFPGVPEMDVTEKFNMLTVLMYFGSDVFADYKGTTLGYHCDVEYNTQGHYKKDNSQKENTPVVILTMGDPRDVFMKKRVADSNGHWVDHPSEGQFSHCLSSESVFVLHPYDEKPKSRNGVHSNNSQFLHGQVKVKEGVSMALVFRRVKKTADIHTQNNTRKLDEKDLLYLDHPVNYKGRQTTKPRREHLDDARREMLEETVALEQQFREYMRRRIDENTFFIGR